MAYNTLAQIIARVRADIRESVNADTLVQWVNDVQEDIGSLDIPIFEKRADLSTTDDTLEYTISSAIGSDVRRIKWVRLDLSTITSPYSNDYEAGKNYRYKYFRFDVDGTKIYFDDDPDGETLEVCYYKLMTAMDDQNDTPTIPLRWRRGLYLGTMAMAAEQQLQTPSGNWYQIYENYKMKMASNERKLGRGAGTVGYYSLI